MSFNLRPLLFILALLLSAPQVFAQRAAKNTAILLADDVRLIDDDTLVATGNVEATYQGKRLNAQSITYRRSADTLTITGPITLQDETGILMLASSAELDRDLQNGILRGARMVLDDQVQLAAAQVALAGGRYTQLYKAAVTSCRVCNSSKPPLWQIRARKVVHDKEKQQLYFSGAQFLVFDTPVFYLPRLRLPDPTLKRATGFLIPSVHNSTRLGNGVKVPYFIKIGDQRDLTLTPFLTTKTRTLELRYRQAFRNGDVEFNGAVSDDDFGRDHTKVYVFGNGRFDLPADFRLTFDIEATNDDTYLLDYDFSDKDRLDSQIAIARTKRDEFIRGAITNFHSLRVNESNATLPTFVGDAEYERRLHPGGAFGGELRFAASLHSAYRTSDLNTDGADFDLYADGRDITRFNTSASWQRNWTLAGGIRAQVFTGVDLDSFQISQAGNTSRSDATEITPSGAIRLRWPLLKVSGTGAAHVIEPMAMLSWIGGSNPNVPNDESTRVEFDEGNLLSLSRFPSPDRRERGLSAAYGISWSRFDPKGWQSSLVFGQVIRDETLFEPNGSGLTSFTSSSGLQNKSSDFLAAGQIKTANGITITSRGIFDEKFNATKAETRASWNNKLADIGATYIWLQRDFFENRPGAVSEVAFDGSYRVARNWTASANWRYDLARNQNVRAGLGMKYTNECVEIALSASRRFTSSTILAPSTSFGLTVAIRGFSTRTQDKSFVRSCRK
ncbi:LPS-assembly protein LptD @ Organic solvent tolerance protein precursor [hydrothermal vent metagenome]|uniref:LPS-assembly protein LptD @ Organic solvent tolerance protein n=1 Tax=hydrothermal vent metagenome TaxID=652676 RepID=A0A3B0SL31_9ZZZZ